MERGLGRPLGLLIAISTALVLLGVSVVPLLTPAWIGFEQERAGAQQLTGYDRGDLETVTGSIVHDLVFGGAFDVQANPSRCSFCFGPQYTPAQRAVMFRVLNDREIAHMQDVRGVFRAFGVVVLIALVVLVATRRLASTPSARRDWWRALRNGALSLAVAVGVLGVVAAVAFDQAFEVFHELFFPAGSFSFDPINDKLVQLFPDQFWSETTLVLGGIAIIVAFMTAFVAGRRGALGTNSTSSTWPTAIRTGAAR
jgi:integral membrane protein (TIGR01906 family)